MLGPVSPNDLSADGALSMYAFGALAYVCAGLWLGERVRSRYPARRWAFYFGQVFAWPVMTPVVVMVRWMEPLDPVDGF